MNEPSETILELREVTKDFPLSKTLFGKTKRVLRAVNNVSFSVYRGKTVGIVGESGSGKTTLARLLLHLIKPTQGSVLYGGKDIFELAGNNLLSFRKDVQAVFQNPFSSLNPRLKVWEIVGEPLLTQKLACRHDIKERVKGLLEMIGLCGEDMERYPHQFSGGQRQRIAVARAISTNARVIILDEPTASLDVSIRAQILNLFRELQARLHLSYVFISHDLALVYCMCDEVIVTYRGKVVEKGPSNEIFSNPVHPYTQILLKSTLTPDPDYQIASVIKGDISDIDPEEKGCPFAKRCDFSFDRCILEDPETLLFGTNHYSACHLGRSSIDKGFQ